MMEYPTYEKIRREAVKAFMDESRSEDMQKEFDKRVKKELLPVIVPIVYIDRIEWIKVWR